LGALSQAAASRSTALHSITLSHAVLKRLARFRRRSNQVVASHLLFPPASPSLSLSALLSCFVNVQPAANSPPQVPHALLATSPLRSAARHPPQVSQVGRHHQLARLCDGGLPVWLMEQEMGKEQRGLAARALTFMRFQVRFPYLLPFSPPHPIPSFLRPSFLHHKWRSALLIVSPCTPYPPPLLRSRLCRPPLAFVPLLPLSESPSNRPLSLPALSVCSCLPLLLRPLALVAHAPPLSSFALSSLSLSRSRFRHSRSLPLSAC
jgi:hypothetical protein